MPSQPLPYLRDSASGLQAQVLYPFYRTVLCATKVKIFWNGSEQRCVDQLPLYEFDLPMNNLNDTDRLAWRNSLFTPVLGRFGSNISLTLGGTTYSDLTLMSDDLAVTMEQPTNVNQVTKLRQTKVAAITYTPPTPGSSFPGLAWGGGSPTTVSAEYPVTQVTTYLTNVSDNPYGPRFAYSWYGAALANFPSTFLRSWKLSYPLLSDADMATLETFFLGCQGRYVSFDFKDPIDGTVYHHVRFDQDQLRRKFLTVNQNATEIVLRQTNGS